jgi:GTP cyclohydrolase I
MTPVPHLYDDLENQIAVRHILNLFDHDPNREGLADTPRRFLKFLYEFTKAQDFSFTTFEKEGYNQMVTVKDIPFFSLCEHHMAPFFGRAHIAYIPNDQGRICGISKLPRSLYKFSNGFQNQERITQQTANFLMENLQPKGVIVCLSARHLCMEMRGVKTHDAETVTTALEGVFADDPSAKAEFFQTLKL